MKKICLVAIVKNSGDILKECLRSFLPFVDSYCISDTGSTDHTLDLIHTECQFKQGYVFSEPFIDFSYNRNRVLEEAEKNCPSDYYLMVDDSYVISKEEGEKLVSYLEKNSHHFYNVYIKNDDTIYKSGKLTTNGLRYKYAIHEVVDSEHVITIPVTIQEKVIPEHLLRTKERLLFDVIHLRKDLERYPNDTRVIFYLARTLYNVEEYKEAELLFNQRIQMNPLNHDFFNSMIYLAIMKEKVFVATYSTDELASKWKELAELYVSIHNTFPTHAEPLYYAAHLYSRGQLHQKAIDCLEQAIEIPFTNQIGAKYLIYTEYIPLLLTKYYYVCRPSECIRLIYHYYIQPKKPFHFMFESYVRLLFRIQPTVRHSFPYLIYHTKGHTSIFSVSDRNQFIEIVTSYTIEDLIIYHIDSIPYFPNIKRIHYIVEGPVLTGSLEAFPMLTSIVCQDQYLIKLSKEIFSLQHLLIPLSQFSFPI